MRAAFLSDRDTSSATLSLLRALSGLGVDATLITPGHGGNGGWKRKSLGRALHEARPDVVHLDVEPHLQLASSGLAEARQLGIAATVGTALESLAPLSWRERRRRRRSLSQVCGIQAFTPRAAALAGAGLDLPVLMAPRAGVVTPADVAPFSPGALVIGFGGRLVAARGLDLLLAAAVDIRGTWELLIAGGGPAQPGLESLAERLGISGRVSWLGSLPAAERAEFWSRADCAVVPAREEVSAIDHTAWGALQAMAAGRPVVATRTGPLPEFVADAGILVAADDQGAMTDALQRLHDDPALRQSLGMAARKRVIERYSTQAVAQRLADLWQRTVAAV